MVQLNYHSGLSATGYTTPSCEDSACRSTQRCDIELGPMQTQAVHFKMSTQANSAVCKALKRPQQNLHSSSTCSSSRRSPNGPKWPEHFERLKQPEIVERLPQPEFSERLNQPESFELGAASTE